MKLFLECTDDKFSKAWEMSKSKHPYWQVFRLRCFFWEREKYISSPQSDIHLFCRRQIFQERIKEQLSKYEQRDLAVQGVAANDCRQIFFSLTEFEAKIEQGKNELKEQKEALKAMIKVFESYFTFTFSLRPPSEL